MITHVSSTMADGAFKEKKKKKMMENVLKKYLRTSGAIRPDLSTKCVVSQVLIFSKSKIIPSIVFPIHSVETKNDNNNIGIK